MTVPYIFANAVGLVPASQLDVNFAYVSNNVSTANTVIANAQPTITSVGILTSLSTSGNIRGGNLLTAGIISATGTITTAGNLSLTGNIVDLGELWINTLSNGNINLNVNGTGNVNMPTGVLGVTGNIQGGNLRTTGLISATANITGGNVLTGGLISATSNITGGNLLTAGLISATGNITTTGLVSATGNITAGNVNSPTLNNSGNIRVVASGNAWTFGSTGNLTLPGNVFAVNYANGNAVTFSSGSGNTGNVTFNDQAVVGTGDQFGAGGLYLAPGNTSVGNLQYLKVRGGDVATHIHLDTGNNSYFDQYFGDDGKYVKLEAGANGNIVIGTVDDTNQEWAFGSNGNLSIPGNINSSGDSSAAPSLHDFFSVTSAANFAIVTDNANTDQTWTFDSAGALTVPGGGAVFTVGTGTIGVTANNTSGNAYLGLDDTSSAATLYGNASVQIVTNGNVSWNFDAAGNLTAPGNISANTITITGFAQLPRYSIANAANLSGAIGYVIALTDSDPIGTLAFWNGTGNVWCYIGNSTPV